MDGKIEKSHGGTAQGPRGRASLQPPLRPSGPAVHPRVIFQFYHPSWKKVKILSKKVRDTQANPRYSAKNNVAMRMIATFMLIFLIYIIIARITFT